MAGLAGPGFPRSRSAHGQFQPGWPRDHVGSARAIAVSRERLQKVLAQAGVASRREAERLISQGRVKVNGATVTQLGTLASPEEDRIELDGTAIAAREAFVYYLLNKPP